MMEIPISKNIIEPKIISNIQYIDSIEEVEKLELHPNEVKLLFDNNRPCFYIKSRDRFGNYDRVRIYFYEDFATKIEGITKEEFISKCKEAQLTERKTKLAIKCFFEKMKNEDVLEWACKNELNYTKDSLRVAKCRIRAKLSTVLTDMQQFRKM